MGVPVDSVIVDLEARIGQYRTDMREAIGLQRQYQQGWAAPANDTGVAAAVSTRKKAASDVVAAEEQATAKVTRTRKARADASVATDAKEVASAKAAAKAKSDAEIAEAERSARYRAIADRAADRAQGRTSGRRSGSSSIGAMTTPEPSGQASIPLAVLAGAGAATGEAEVAVQKEINAGKVEEIRLQDSLNYLTGARKREVQELQAEMRLSAKYEAEGVSEAEIALRLEQRRSAVAAEQALVAKKGAGKTAAQFAEGAGFRRGGSDAVIAGIGTVAAIGVATELVKTALDYAKALKDTSQQLGINVEQLQVYQRLAQQTGVSQEQLTSAFGQFNSMLGKAQEGGKEQGKIFTALGIGIKDFANAGEALPTVIDQLSKIQDQSKRAAFETALFGESGRKLDALLGGGVDQVNNLAKAMSDTGEVLSQRDIQQLDQTAEKLAEINNQLKVDLSRSVAGNVEAINGLAGAFAGLTGGILTALGALRRFSDESVTSGVLSNFYTDAAKGRARNELLGSSAGRNILKTQNTKDIVAITGNDPDDPRVMQANAKALLAKGDPDLKRLLAERRQINARDAADNAPIAIPKAQGGALGDISKAFAPDPKKGPKGPSAETLAREAEQRTKQFQDRLAGYEESQLRSQESMTGDIQAQAAIENKIALAALAKQIDDIESQRKQNLTKKGVNAALEDQRAAVLKQAATAAEQAESDAREQDVDARFSQEQERIYEDRIAVDREGISAREALARTDKDRLKLALDDLAKQQKSERSSLQNQIDTAKPGTDVTAQQNRLDHLDSTYADRAKAVQQQYAGPLGSYLNSLPRTGDEIKEAFEGAAVDGVKSLNDQLATTIEKMTGLHGLAGQLLTDFIRIALQAEESKLFGAATGGGGSGGSFLGGSGKIFGSILGGGGGSGIIPGSLAEGSAFSATSAEDLLSVIPGLATGGPAGAGRTYLVGEHGPEVLRMGSQGGTIVPNHQLTAISPNQGVSAAAPQITVVAPRHYDLSNSLIDRDTLAQMNAENRAYAEAVGRASYGAAVQTAAGQVPTVLSQTQQLKS